MKNQGDSKRQYQLDGVTAAVDVFDGQPTLQHPILRKNIAQIRALH